MGLLNFRKAVNINQEVKAYNKTQGAILLDVRTLEEYQEGHIPGSINIPLQNLDTIQTIINPPNTPLFVYCRSGKRSNQAVSELKSLGYSNVKNIGGILSYMGELEK